MPRAHADERLAHAYEEIKRADEQLTRMSEQLAKIRGDAPHPAAAAPAPPSPATAISPCEVTAGASLACANIPSANIASEAGAPEPHGFAAGGGLRRHCPGLSSAYGGGVVARWTPQLGSTRSSPPDSPTLAAQSAPSIVQVAAAETATPQGAPPQATPPQPTSVAQAQTAPQDTTPPAVAPPAAAAPPDQAQLLQKIARDLATLERNMEQLKASQQQTASDNAKAIGDSRPARKK